MRARALQEEQDGPDDAAPQCVQVMERPSRWLSSSELKKRIFNYNTEVLRNCLSEFCANNLLKHFANSALGISILQV